MSSPPSIDLDIVSRLKSDREFRREYFLAETSATIARQLISLRKRRGLSQHQVAEELNTKQPAISRVESADYRNWSFNTLRKLAEALDARLRVYIEPSEDVVADYSENRGKPRVVALSDLQKLFGAGVSRAPARKSLIEEQATGLGLGSPREERQHRASILDNEQATLGGQLTEPQGKIKGVTWNSLVTTSLV